MKHRVRKSRIDCKKKIIYYGIDDGTLRQQFSDSSTTEDLSNCEEDNDSLLTNSTNDSSCSEIHNNDPTESSSSLLVGDVVWAKCSGHNLWPSMIAYDPNTAVYFHTSVKSNNNTPQKYHVQFFGEKALRGWVSKSNIIKFQGLQHFLSIANCNFSSPSQKEIWEDAVRAAEEAILFNRKERKLAYVFNYQSKASRDKRRKLKKKVAATKINKVSSDVTRRRSSRLNILSVKEEDTKPTTVDSSYEPSNPCQIIHTATVKLEKLEKSTVNDLRETNQYSSCAKKKSPVNKSTSVLQDITWVENHLLNEAGHLNAEYSCDSGIEDSEALESSCDDMDSLGLRRKRKPKVFEGFHTGDDIIDAFKTKSKGKVDSVKGNKEEAEINHKLDKENIVAQEGMDVASNISIKSAKCNIPKKGSKSNEDDGEKTASEDDKTCSTEKETVSQLHLPAGRNAKRKCSNETSDTSDEAPRASKKTKSLPVHNVSKKVVYTKIKSGGNRNSNLQEVLSDEKAVTTDDDGGVDSSTNSTQKDDINESNKLKRGPKDQFCSMCEEVTGDLLTCSGACLNQFHPNCLGLNFMPTNNFICDECTTGYHTCFVCNKAGEIKKCSQNTCGKYYHIQCLENNDCTKFENKVKDKFTCPLHVCRYCNKNKSLKMTNGKRIVKCVRCPTAYHLDHCMPAGCLVLTLNHMVCDEHFEPSKSSSHTHIINTTWCIICSFGGALVCCDTCPASFHAECSDDLDGIPEGVWQCRDCRNGNKLRYGDIVWIKFSVYRWWPGKICLPEDVPVRIQNMSHSVGEFPVLFFGSHDYVWLSSRRVFKYAEGDMGGSNAKSYLEKYFQKALQEAKEAFLEIEKKREEHIQALDKKQLNKPPTYGHAKVNKPVSCIQTILDRSEWPICQCKPEDPCEKECLNKMLYYECNPSQCPNKENCKNQRIQKFQYAKTKMFKCEEKGWGLKADQEIKTGVFVIEYVGELIDEATCRNRIKQYHERDIYDYYFLTIDKDNIIDAYPRGNLSRFMNHSCDPNCETQKWTVNGEVRVGLFATRDILLGEELSFNYNLDCLGNEKKKCKCGSANCSGYLGVRPKTQHSISVAEKLKKSKEEVKEKRKVKRKKKAKIVHDDECFSCGDGGELLCCDRQHCTKAYHQDCLIMEQAPKGKWQCPWHFCDECGKLAKSMCSLCPNSFCEGHLDGQMVELMDDVLVCPVHDEEEMQNLKKENVGESPTSKSGSNSSKYKQKKPPSKKLKSVSIVKVSNIGNKFKKRNNMDTSTKKGKRKGSETSSSESEVPLPKSTKVKTPEKAKVKTAEKTKGKTSGKTKVKTPEKIKVKASEKTKVKTPEKTKVKTPEKTKVKTSRKTKDKTPQVKSSQSNDSSLSKKDKKDTETVAKKMLNTNRTENSFSKKNGLGEKRKHLMKATQKVKEMKMNKNKSNEELIANSNIESDNELVEETEVSCIGAPEKTSIFEDVDIIGKELKKLSNENKKKKETMKTGRPNKKKRVNLNKLSRN